MTTSTRRGDPFPGQVEPEPGTGTVFVCTCWDGSWRASWQEDEDPGHVIFEGTQPSPESAAHAGPSAG